MRSVISAVLVSVPIASCLALAFRGPAPGPAGFEPHQLKEPARGADRPVTVVMRSAPGVAESAGGIPVDLAELLEAPGKARAQTERVALLYGRWALMNPRAAVQSAFANARLLDSDFPLQAALEGWLKAEPEAAMDWGTEMGERLLRDAPIANVFEIALVSQAVATQAAWAARFPGEAGPASRVAAEWVRMDPDAAVEWLARLEPGAAKSEGLRALTIAWMESDPEAAGAFVASMDEGRLREIALAAVAAISPGGVALEPATGIADAGSGSAEREWLVEKEAKAHEPRVIKRRPAAAEER